MKIHYFLIILIFFISCAGLKYDPVHGQYIILNAFNGIKNVEKIKVWEKPLVSGSKPFTYINPGVKVKLLEIKGPMALIELPDGKTGWIQKVHIK